MVQCALMCSNVCKQRTLRVNKKFTPIIYYKGEIFLYNKYTVYMIVKLGPSSNTITKMFTTELHVCKQQHTPTAN